MDEQPDSAPDSPEGSSHNPQPDAPNTEFEPTLPPSDGVEPTHLRTVADADPTLDLEHSKTMIPTGTSQGGDSLASEGSSLETQDPSDATGLHSGLELGNYRLIEQVGEGAQGQVWKAFNILAEKPMALKFVSAKLAGKVRAITSMKGEASVMFDLTHESIVRLNNIEQIDGHAFLVMEFLGGPSLSSVIQQRKRETKKGLSPEECIWLLDQLAPALDYAGSKNVTHRDIKPGNIMLTLPVEASASLVNYSGQVKLCDFGIAFVSEGEENDTDSFSAAGTPPYMAPEVIRGEKPMPRADLYSLGATLFALHTGRPPFRGSMRKIHEFQQAGPPPPLESGNKAFDQAVAKALSYDPAERFGSADEFLFDASNRKLGRKAERKTRQVWTVVAAAAIVACGIGFMLWRLGLEATEVELLQPTQEAMLTNQGLMEVAFRIDNAKVRDVLVGFGETADPYAFQKIGRDGDGVFRTTLPLPPPGKFPLQIRTDERVWGSYPVTYDNTVEASFQVEGMGPFEVGDPIPCKLTVYELPVTVINRTGGGTTPIELTFSGDEARFQLPAPDLGGSTRGEVLLRIQVQDAALNRVTKEVPVNVHDRAAVIESFASGFPLTPQEGEPHPWDLELDRRKLGDWTKALGEDPLVDLAALNDASERSGQRADLMQLLATRVQKRPDPAFAFEEPSQGTIAFEGGLYRLHTNNLRIELKGAVQDSRDGMVSVHKSAADPGRQETLDRESGAFGIWLEVPAGEETSYRLRHTGLLQDVRLNVVHEDTPPVATFQEGAFAPRSQEAFTLEVRASDAQSGVDQVLVEGSELSRSVVPGESDLFSGRVSLAEEGPNPVTILVRDRAGNELTEHRTVVRDTARPKNTDSAVLDGSVVAGQTEQFRFTFDEPIRTASVDYAVKGPGGETLLSGSLPAETLETQGSDLVISMPIPDTEANDLDLIVKAADLAGNEGLATGTWEVTYNPWGVVPKSLSEGAEMITGQELVDLLPPALGGGPYVRSADGSRYPRLIRHLGTGIEFVFVEPGSFEYGEPRTSAAGDMRMSPFYIARTEVSVEQFLRGKLPDEFPTEGIPEANMPIPVFWRDAYLWCDSAGLALPTEAQWEYAASGPENRNYPWGDVFEIDHVHYNSKPLRGQRPRPTAVDDPRFQNGASWCGALQMAGNAYEYCRDIAEPPEVPEGEADHVGTFNPGLGQPRMLRGGSCEVQGNQTERFATFFRGYKEQTSLIRRNGFRPVWEF